MPTETCIDQADAALKAAFETKYGRDWNDPAGDDMKAIWLDAWIASRSGAVAQLTAMARQLRNIPLKGRIGDWHDAQTTAASFDSCADFLTRTS